MYRFIIHVLKSTLLTHRFRTFEPHKEDINSRHNGLLISSEQGQEIGGHTRNNDLEVNIIKGKKLTNMRSAGADGAAKIAQKINFSLEESMDYIKDDEYLEVTPQSLRMRKI